MPPCRLNCQVNALHIIWFEQKPCQAVPIPCAPHLLSAPSVWLRLSVCGNFIFDNHEALEPMLLVCHVLQPHELELDGRHLLLRAHSLLVNRNPDTPHAHPNHSALCATSVRITCRSTFMVRFTRSTSSANTTHQILILKPDANAR